MSSHASGRRRRREEYEKLLRILDYQTATTDSNQPALLSRMELRNAATNAGMDRETMKKRLRAAVENGHVLEWHGEFALVTEEKIEAVRDQEIAAENQRKMLIGKCNIILQQHRKDEEEAGEDG